MQAVIDAFNRAASGKLRATHVNTFADRAHGLDAIRLRIGGVRPDGYPFELTSAPIRKGADPVACVLSMLSVAQSYRMVAGIVGPIVRKSIMAGEIKSRMAKYRASRDALLTEFDRVLTEADAVHGDAKSGLKLLSADIAAVRAETRDMQSELGGMTNGGPPLSDGETSSVQSPKPGDA